ncbi:MAG: hypothetical protein U0232_19790 [Thermomicrobiales bacterium]
MSAAAPRPDRLWGARRLIAAAFAALAAIQIGVILWLIWVAPVRVPWQDELFHFAFFMKARAGNAAWADYWQPLGGVHRTVFPRLLYVLAIEATGWDRRVWLTINPLLVAGACAALWATARRTSGSRAVALALLAPIAALLFALSQYSQWLNPFGLQFALVVACGALALWALSAGGGGWPSFALAVGATWVASWSGLHGLALWAALLPLVALAGWRKVPVWMACAVVVIGTYANGLPRQNTQGITPGGLLAYALANLGSPLGTLQSAAGGSSSGTTPRSRLRPPLGARDRRGERGAVLLGNLFVAWRQGARSGESGAVSALVLPCGLAAACALLTGVGRASTTRVRRSRRALRTFALLCGSRWWRSARRWWRRRGGAGERASGRAGERSRCGESGGTGAGCALLRLGQSGEWAADARPARRIALDGNLRPRPRQCPG